MHLVLGSQSPRRKEILNFFSVPFEQASPDYDEEAIPFNGNPSQFVNILSNGKAESLKSRFPSSIIITADTVVYHDGKSYGKPKDKNDAFNTLSKLSGKCHSVFTGVTVQQADTQYYAYEETKVFFHPLTPEQIHLYHDQLHLDDKAGAYAIQQAGAIAVRSIEGCYYNVMGMPITTLKNLLYKVGIDLWHYLPNIRLK